MKRSVATWLIEWYSKRNRKPLILRGARQVGKTFAVRDAARQLNVPLFEINLERHTRLDTVFQTLDVKKILQECELVCGTGIDGKKPGILFFDEIQAVPSALPALRYFFEEMPSLAVVAAGSLLEFALSRHSFSMPVGRIEFVFLGPMTFEEFLVARGEDRLVHYIERFQIGDAMSPTVHERMLDHVREFMMVGGMPEAVREYTETGSLAPVRGVHESIIETYRSDFSKFAALDDLALFRRVFDYVPAAIGRKFKYVNVDPVSRARQVRNAFTLLAQAGVVIPVTHTSASGIPLSAESEEGVFKPLFLDIGLMNASCGIGGLSIDQFRSKKFIYEGGMAEQFVGQHLLHGSAGTKPSLHYWLREGKSNNAEVDYVIQAEGEIVPIEVKAGKAGTLKSLLRFMADKSRTIALRFDLSTPSSMQIDFPIPGPVPQGRVRGTLLSLPLYLVGQVNRLIQSQEELKITPDTLDS